MNSKDVYGKISNKIKEHNGCWLWTGYLSNGVPYTQVNRRKRRVVSIGLRAVGAGPIHKYNTACEQKTCVHPEHVVDVMSEVGRMLYIKSKIIERDDCFEWTGDFSDTGEPRMAVNLPNGEQSTGYVRKFTWCVEHIPAGLAWPQGDFTMQCENATCVNVGHIRFTSWGSHENCLGWAGTAKILVR